MPRRRSRRQELSTTGEQPDTAATRAGSDGQEAMESTSRPRARRAGRATTPTNGVMETMGTIDAVTALNGALAPQDGIGAEETAPRRQRATRKAAAHTAQSDQPAVESVESETPVSVKRAPSPRVSRGRRVRAAVSAEAASGEAPAAPVIPGLPVEEVVDAATGPARPYRSRRAPRPEQAVDAAAIASGLTDTPAAESTTPHQPEAMRPEHPEHKEALTPLAASTPEGAPAAETRPASSYRFARPRTDERAANEVPASTEPAAPAQDSASPAMRGVAYQPGMPPRRRFDRSDWTGQEARDTHEGRPATGGVEQPYRRTNEPHGQRGSQPRGGRPQAGAPRGPYLPGGRGQQPASTPGHDNAPAQPTPNTGNNGNSQGTAPATGGYTPYELYASQPGQAPYDRDRVAGQGRPLRNRNYTGQPGYPNQPGYGDQRSPRGPQSYRDRDNYRDAYRDQGTRAPYDRRCRQRAPRGLGGRTYNRTPRENGYDRTFYTPAAPGAPAPNAPAGQDTRYSPEGRYTAGVRQQTPASLVRTVDVSGILWMNGGQGLGPAEILDGRTLLPIARMNPEDARRMGLRSGDEVRGRAEERNGRRLVVAVDTVNDVRPEDMRERPLFEQLTASFPDRRIRLEQGPQPISSRIIDLFSPLGFGSRALIVAPPKTGKTTLIREAAESVLKGYPDAVVMAVLVGERPEEVTDLRARLEPRGGLVYAASFDEDTQRHAWLVALAVERAKRVAESGKDAFMVLDSLTRLARAENLASRGQGRTLSGGIDAQALDTGRRAFGAARNLEEGGSLTILATCLVDTGCRQDDVVYEEFKGTGNMELHLSRDLAQRRLFPAIDAVKSGTRREEILLTPDELRAATALRRRLADLPAQQATQQLLSVMERTPSNAALLQAIEQSGWIGGAR